MGRLGPSGDQPRSESRGYSALCFASLRPPLCAQESSIEGRALVGNELGAGRALAAEGVGTALVLREGGGRAQGNTVVHGPWVSCSPALGLRVRETGE